jgi:hypothetical protein
MVAMRDARTDAAVSGLPTQQGLASAATWLRDHLLHDHGRTAHELDGVPLPAMHRLEHLEQTMSLVHLGHHHEGDALRG